MKSRASKSACIALAAVLTLWSQAWNLAAEKPATVAPSPLDKLVEQPAELSPWAYEWRADRQVQEKPEAYFIPRRLERIDKVYRDPVVLERQRKLKMVSATLAPPKGRLCAGLLWLCPTEFERVELHWPADGAEPPPDAVEVRSYPCKPEQWGGWFGVVNDVTMAPPKVSADRRIWVYRPSPGQPNATVTDMVAVFLDESKLRPGAKHGSPQIRLFGAQTWKRMDLEIEWGLQPGTEKAEFDGDLESWVGVVHKLGPLPEDKGTTLAGERGWRSKYAADSGRRGVALAVEYVPRDNPGAFKPLDTRITLRTKNGSFTFLPSELNFTQAIIMPELGFVVMKAGSGKTGRQRMDEWAARNPKCLPQMTREHAEIASWEDLMRRVRFDPALTNLPPLQPFQEELPATAMRVQLPDERWTDAWRRSSWQLSIGNGGYWTLCEGARPIHAMDLVGLHATSARRLDYWLKAPGRMPEGDFVDGEGSLQYAQDRVGGICWSVDGVHEGTGWFLFDMAERSLLSGDKEWFLQNRPRIQAAADWLVRQRRRYLQDVPNRDALECAGLHPPLQLGCDFRQNICYWRWYLSWDSFSLKGLGRFADALAEIDASAAEKYREEARAYAADIQRAVEREIVWSPVRPARDGAYYRWIPVSLYTRGTMEHEIVQEYPCGDVETGSLTLADRCGLLDPRDPRMAGHLNLVEDKLYPGGGGADTWFFARGRGILLKWSFVADLHLLRDDVPCFLRHWMVHYASCVEPDGSFREWGGGDRRKTWDSAGLRPYSPPGGTEPRGWDRGKDLMYTGWFMENFRNLLVMEQDDTLWLARATPRAWLKQGQKIGVQNAPTYYGTVAYEIVSDVDQGKISATVAMPSRKTPKEVVLRFRHPQSAPIKSVTVNGKEWKGFNKDKETIELKGLTGRVAVTASY